MTDADTRPQWAHTSDMRSPRTIYAAPSFKDELGVVFLGIGEGSPGITSGDGWSGDHHGIWLNRRQVEELAATLPIIATWAEEHSEDDKAVA